ncbi:MULTISPECIES: phage tail sheath C-terminal domain-containing protein [unclassified Caballeronia]|uniref:phage tail sheath family protein n=1 Tax=unclassified Caballeronia TaxID=2646786 RepID=UPI00285C70A1|nr:MULTISPECIES: phage tail sheath C-terminal domain-containing protein [unclassified Caballeronia]MDR5816414.1 phage tail sheath C-terminal domain-containing protein [Caballeronia sp. LZ033]MDR5881212.1 phage tail sheath C-terminal domain-containing protein [Caballeronia sp. LZ032]
MSVTTSFPGVYIAESDSPTFSVSTAPTAIPLFSMNADFSSTAVRFESYMEVARYFGADLDVKRPAIAGLRAYFEAGGGPCYAVSHDYLEQEASSLGSTISLVVANAFDIIPEFSSLDVADGLFFILDGPEEELTIQSRPTNLGSSALAAAYYPWLKARWTDADIAPSAVVAALYGQNDRTRGVWKAPANIALPASLKPKYQVTDDLQAEYMSAPAINMIRTFRDQNPVIWGARTLDESDDWRYVSVRRLFLSVERDIRKAMNTLMFESNVPHTWEKARSAVTSYLRSIWQQGGLMGISEEEAFFVQIGKGVTMSDTDIAQGKMIMKIGLAASRPAEFIILQFTQNLEGA